MFDKKCLELAESFLSDYVVTDSTAVAWIAQRIQTGIDDDIQDLMQSGRIKSRDAAPAAEPKALTSAKPASELPPVTGSLNLVLGDLLK